MYNGLLVLVDRWFFRLLLIDIRQPGWEGCVLAFLALCKVGFVFGLCAPCNVLKMAWGQRRRSFRMCQTGTLYPNRVTYNGYGLAMWRHLKIVNPVTTAKFINTSSLFILLLGVIRWAGTEAK